MLSQISPSLMSKISYYSSFPSNGVSLRQMVEFGKNPNQGTMLRATQFLSDELPIRLAKRVIELNNLPFGLNKMPSILRVKHWYAESFQELIEFPKIEIAGYIRDKYRNSFMNGKAYYTQFDASDTQYLPVDTGSYIQDFTNLISAIKRRHDPTMISMAWGIIEWKNKDKDNQVNKEIQIFLDRFYLSRIGIRVLIGQQVALQSQPPQKDYVGIICTNTNLGDIAKEAAENARYICQEHFAIFDAPKVEIVCPPGLSILYLPSHLHHMIFELLKNSLRAVVEFHGLEKEEYPPIKLIIAEGKEDITIKISDEGGGIPRSGLPLIFTYLYTTANIQFDENSFQFNEFNAPMAGFGYGLPISRLYARYFGGDLAVISMEGYGTDAYLHLSRLSDSKEPLP
ncbi:Histidine kinase-like ATPase, ATP-binding domain-containing protein [Rozella allomycis CSF55]|uniref:Protein-serine/threonine kinase n=1 Tax=Rozella allomycis (strain CSF55) TaxID=988480 RepID=A0A075B4J7_ROZAC|nr:Histidine kinase-like ATPase, ATP-binding domain-containing protein [Rozella allomycis CSF55]|eukprot:EPZ36222.1 Histidine kinase-like ATPase, ATP-binding domain-containing protein [Rozella allomycis CSF55]